MKKMMYLLATAALAFAFASCEKDLEPNRDQTSRLNFVYGEYFRYTVSELEQYYEGDSYNNKSYSFIYDGNGTDRDTVCSGLGCRAFFTILPALSLFSR